MSYTARDAITDFQYMDSLSSGDVRRREKKQLWSTVKSSAHTSEQKQRGSKKTLNTEIEDLNKLNDDLNKRWNEEYRTAVRQKRENDRLKSVNTTMVDEMKQQADRISVLERKNQLLKTEIAELNKQNDNLYKQWNKEHETFIHKKREHNRLTMMVEIMTHNVDKHAAEKDNFKRELQQQADKHQAEQEAYQHEISVLDKARCEAETKLSQMTKIDLSFLQLLSDNITNLAQLNVLRQEKADLQARVDQMTTDPIRLQQNIDELTEKLDVNERSVECSRQTCVTTNHQLRATHEKLIATQQELELVIQSNNELQHCIDSNRIVTTLSPEHSLYASSTANSISQSTSQPISQLIDQSDIAGVKMGLLVVVNDHSIAHQSINQSVNGTNIDVWRTRCEKIESMLDATDARNEKLEKMNLSLSKLLLACLVDLKTNHFD